MAMPNQSQDRFVYTCNNCKGHVETRYHCTVCDDFDLCETCFEKDGHPHKMEKLGLDLDDGSSPVDQKQANPQDERKFSIQRCIHSLEHAYQCQEANCRLPSCRKMKRVVQHTKVCKRKANGNCPICKQLIALCGYHAKDCPETKCLVPFCLNIKHKMKQQQLQQRLQQAQLLRRRMAVMNTRGGGGGGLSGGTVSPVDGGAGPPDQLMGVARGPQSPHPPIGHKPDSQTPPANVLQVVKKDARKLFIRRCIHSLEHACQCRDTSCRLSSCQKMKVVVQHTKVCKRKANENCSICKQVIALCGYHSNNCPETKCLLPFCLNIKHKKKQYHLQHAEILRRRLALMNTQGGGGGNLIGGAVSPVDGGAGPPDQLIGVAGVPQPPHPPIGHKPGSQTPPVNVLQVVKQVQEEAARQQAPQETLGYPGKETPSTVQQVMPPPQRSIQVPGLPLLPMDQSPGYQSTQMQTGAGGVGRATGPGAGMLRPPGGAQAGTTGPEMGAATGQPVMQLGGQVATAQAAMRQPLSPGQPQQENSTVQKQAL